MKPLLTCCGLALMLLGGAFFARGRPELQGWLLTLCIISLTAGMMWQSFRR
jgi:hypothetical protein